MVDNDEISWGLRFVGSDYKDCNPTLRGLLTIQEFCGHSNGYDLRAVFLKKIVSKTALRNLICHIFNIA